MTLEEQFAKGEKAKKILENEIISGAFNSIKEDYLDAFSKLDFEDKDKMAEINISLKNLSKLKDKFERVITDGSVAKKKLEKQNKVNL